MTKKKQLEHDRLVKDSTQLAEKCNKVIYKRINHAKSVAGKTGFHPYRCRFCGHWHLTSQNLSETF